MKTSDILWRHVQDRELCPGADSLATWLDHDWLTIRVAGRARPVFPMWGLRNALTLHDVHHVLTGYDTSIAGESELAAWELGSGGCGYNLFFWIDRTLLAIGASILMPRRMLRAFQRGRGCRNLYRRRRAAVLAMEFEEVRRLVHCGGGAAR